MSFIDGFRHRLRSVLRAEAVERERDEEFAFHHSLSEQELRQGAVDGQAARHAARREFGNATYLNEEIRRMGALRWIDAMRQDLRFGARTLRRSPVFALVAVLSIGLGIGANTAIFGMIHRLLLERLPVSRPQELVQVRRAEPTDAPSFFSYEEYEALAASRAITMTGFAGTYCDDAEINGSSPLSISVDLVDDGFFSFLGISTEAGRLFTRADHDEVRPVAVVSFVFAARHYGSAAGAIDQIIKLHDAHFTIVGVLPRGFAGLIVAAPLDVLAPRSTFRLFQDREAGQERPAMHILGRVNPGSNAAAAVDNAFQRCCADGQLGDPITGYRKGQHVVLTDMSRGMPEVKFDMRAEFSRVFLALMTGVALLLLIACSNIGNLLLARAVVRGRELSVRLSLGASRGRIVRQLLVESTLLASLGAALGLILAFWGTALLARHLPANLGMLQSFVALRPSLVIFAFAAGVTITCALLFGVLPAVRATRLDLIAGLRETRPTAARGKLDRAVVALQVSLALVLASSAGLLIATLRNVASGGRVFEPEHLLIAEIDLRGTSYENTPQLTLHDRITERIRQIPGVRTVGVSSVLPFLFMGATIGKVLDLPGYESVSDEDMIQDLVLAVPGYFDAMNMTLKAGRDFGAQDRRGGERVVIVSENFAERYFAGRNPIGGTIRFRGEERASLRVVGVVEDVKYYDLRAAAPLTVYMPWAQWERPFPFVLFAIRTESESAALAATVQDAIDETAPGIKVRRVRTLTESMSFQLGREQTLAWLATAFGVLAVLLAAIGLYGVLAYQVNARSREIGVRMALGADPGRVVRMILRQSFLVVAIGVVIGVPMALLAGRALASQLYGLSPFHPGPLAAAALVLLMVGMIASLLPSRNAARVDPLIAIRSD
jgi:predicted permease